jgi:hypothetical protein
MNGEEVYVSRHKFVKLLRQASGAARCGHSGAKSPQAACLQAPAQVPQGVEHRQIHFARAIVFDTLPAPELQRRGGLKLGQKDLDA